MVPAAAAAVHADVCIFIQDLRTVSLSIKTLRLTPAVCCGFAKKGVPCKSLIRGRNFAMKRPERRQSL